MKNPTFITSSSSNNAMIIIAIISIINQSNMMTPVCTRRFTLECDLMNKNSSTCINVLNIYHKNAKLCVSHTVTILNLATVDTWVNRQSSKDGCNCVPYPIWSSRTLYPHHEEVRFIFILLEMGVICD